MLAECQYTKKLRTAEKVTISCFLNEIGDYGIISLPLTSVNG
jgi:hypothetical protein